MSEKPFKLIDGKSSLKSCNEKEYWPDTPPTAMPCHALPCHTGTREAHGPQIICKNPPLASSS